MAVVPENERHLLHCLYELLQFVCLNRIDRWMQPNGVRAGGQRITNDQMNGDAFYGVLFSPSSYGSIAQVTQPEWIEWATAATRTIDAK